MFCPRCQGELRSGARGGGSPFRAVHFDTLRCDRCNIEVLDAEQARRLLGEPEVGGDASERNRRGTRQACPTPGCFANLDEVTLTWAKRWVQVEQCPRCLAMIVDPGEIDRLATLTR